jgi:hexosaminidase
MYRRLEIQSSRLETVGLTHRSSYDVLLQRIAGGQSPAPLRVVADLVEPVKQYMRGQLRMYTSATPLDRLVDAARPESLSARRFQLEVDRFLLTAPESRRDKLLRDEVSVWKANHAVLEPILTASALGAEARPLSKDLAALGTIGLEALDALAASRPATGEWLEGAKRLCDRAQRPRAELEIAVVPAVRKLALAAGQLAALKTMTLEDWNRSLDEQVTEAKTVTGHH